MRYAVGDVLYWLGRALARIPRALGRGFAGFWRRLSVTDRRRLLAAVSAIAAILLFLGLAVPKLPCQFPGGDRCPPADDAEQLVPADALAYLHANLDPGTDEFSAAADRAATTPVISAQIESRALALLPGLSGTPAQFNERVRPWFGGEAAIAVIGGPRAPEQVALFEVSDADGASEFAAGLGPGGLRTETYSGTVISTDARGLATAQVGGFLVIGSDDGVRAVVDAADGDTDSLADDATANEARDQLPEHRFAEAWLSPEGASELIAGARGQLGTLSALIEPGSTRGAAASLSATGDGYQLAIRSLLDPERTKSSPGFFAAFGRFDPQLPERLPSDSLGYLGFGEPGTTVKALLAQASAQAPGIAAGFEDLVRKLRRQGGVDLEGQLLASLGDEAAVAIAPRPAGGQGSAGGQPALPYLEFVADGVDEDRARAALAALQGPVADAARSDVQAPVFGQQEIDGVDARSLRISPAVELTYAVFDGLAAVATDPEGIAKLAGDHGGLDEQDLFKRATGGDDSGVSLLGFLDLGGLVATGEQLGLAEDPVYATFAGDFRRLDALGLSVSSREDELSTDLRLLLSD